MAAFTVLYITFSSKSGMTYFYYK